MLFLFGFGRAPKSIDSYGVCLVKSAEKLVVGDSTVYVADCFDESVVIFPRMIKENDKIVYSPYFVDDDTITVHGYIRSIDEAIP